MVELYELKLMPIDADNCWPPDIDQHVAQLDFGTSMMMDGQSVFGSVMVDPTVSTDSLDMDTMLRRCQDNKNNDYKLTFEDSGQWTTSGIGGSFTTTTNTTTASPPMPESRKVLNLLRKGNNSILHDDRDNHNISLRLLEELNNGTASSDDDEICNRRQRTTKLGWRDKLFDEILNNNGNDEKCNDDNGAGTNGGFGEFTTWGRISRKSTEAMQQPPFNSDNVNSLPELNESNKRDKDGHEGGNFSNKAISSPTIARTTDGKQQQSSNVNSERSGNLVTNFMEHFKSKEDGEKQQQHSPMDYEYSEVYLGNGRYIDMNDNEIGFVPPSTAPIQGRVDLRQMHSQGVGTSNSNNANYRRSESAMNGLKSSPRRTFADLSASRTAPDLKFIALSHKVPSICNSSTSFENLLKKAKSGNFNEMLQCCASSEKIVSDNNGGGTSVEESDEIPDSGLGSSHSEGPSHIEDWPSLSILLPRSVVDACSFFKSNQFLLSGSSNSIERRSPISNSHPPRSFTSTGIRRLSRWSGESREDRPVTACCPNCLGGSSTMNSAEDICRSAIVLQSRHCATDSSQRATQKLRLHAKELAMIGLPLYDQKRNLVERIVEGVAEMLRGGSCIVLLAALEKLLEDGLKIGTKAWEVVRAVTGPGPVTASVFQLIEELEAIEKPENSRVSHFLQGLVSLHSVEGWFSYIVLKENVLRQFYMESAFFIGAHTAYRSLFSRFVECLELLSVLNQCGLRKRMQHKRRQFSMNSIERNLSTAAKMPSDSRVPKSSSMPTKLAKNTMEKENFTTNDLIPEIVEPMESQNSETAKPSKIPILRSLSKSNSLLKRSHSSSFRKTPTRVCRVREAVEENECQLGTVLPAEKGENVRVLSVRGQYSRCARFGPNQQAKGNLTIQNGILPTGKLIMDER